MMLVIAVLLLSACVDVEAQRDENTMGEKSSSVLVRNKPTLFVFLQQCSSALEYF